MRLKHVLGLDFDTFWVKKGKLLQKLLEDLV